MYIIILNNVPGKVYSTDSNFVKQVDRGVSVHLAFPIGGNSRRQQIAADGELLAFARCHGEGGRLTFV